MSEPYSIEQIGVAQVPPNPGTCAVPEAFGHDVIMDVHVGRLEPADWLGRTLRVVMDRPLGSLHPEYGFRYELNYGYVPGYIAPDGEELDAYVVGTDEVLDECEGVVVAVIRRHDDIEDKLVVAVDDRQRGVEVITAAVAFQEASWNSEVVVAP